MNLELNEKIENFLNNLDNSDIVVNYRKNKNKVKNNQEIINLIEIIKTKEKNSIEFKELKQKIYSFKEYQEYMYYEQQLNYLILFMNSKINLLVKGKQCEL